MSSGKFGHLLCRQNLLRLWLSYSHTKMSFVEPQYASPNCPVLYGIAWYWIELHGIHARVLFQSAGFVVKLAPLLMTRKIIQVMRQSFPNMNKRQLPSHWLEGPFRKVEHLHALFKIAFQCKWLSSPLYNYIMFKLPETTCFQQAGWRAYGKLTGEFVAITVIAITMASLCTVSM